MRAGIDQWITTDIILTGRERTGFACFTFTLEEFKNEWNEGYDRRLIKHIHKISLGIELKLHQHKDCREVVKKDQDEKSGSNSERCSCRYIIICSCNFEEWKCK